MLLAFALALVAVISGWLLSYFYLAQTTPALRFCAGACTGLALLGLVGFLFASFFDMTSLTFILTGAVTALPLLLLRKEEWRSVMSADVRRIYSRTDRMGIAFGVLLVSSLLLIFSFAMYERGGGIFTGFDNNLGDLPFHVGIITGFAKGENFPPQHTEYAGVRLTYPFLVDFIAALFVQAGATLQGALLIENVFLALAFVGAVYGFARELTGDKAAARLSIVLVLLSGGLGVWKFLGDAATQGLFATLTALPRNYTITPAGGYRWGNALTVLLIPQRSLLLGTPLFLLACTLLWQALRGEHETQSREEDSPDIHAARRLSTASTKRDKKKQRKAARLVREIESDDYSDSMRREATKLPANLFASQLSVPALLFRRMFAAGLIAGTLPLVHAHAFAVLLAIAAALAVLFRAKIPWRAWAIFFALALVLAAPQIIWVTRDSPVRAGDFVAWAFGWDRGAENPVWFWLKNTGVFLPLLVAALMWRRGSAGERASLLSRRVKLFYVPFACIFVGANMLRLSPWVWDNIKLFFLWFVASAPLVSLLLVHLWRGGKPAIRTAVAAFVVMLTAAGALDILRVVEGAAEQRIFSREDVQFASFLERTAAPSARILHAPVYNHPVFLTGRRSLMGYPGHLWTHGISYQAREREIQSVYAGAPEAADVLHRHRIDYIVVSPHERNSLTINERALSNYNLIANTGTYKIYRVAADQ